MFLFVFILLIVALMLAVLLRVASQDKKNEELAALDRRLKYTGMSEIKFTLKGSGYRTEEEKEVFKNLKEGKRVILLQEPWNPVDKNAISVWFHGKRIGYMDRDKAYAHKNDLFGKANVEYKYCVVSKIIWNEDYDTPIVDLSAYYSTSNGTAVLNINKTSIDFTYIDPIEGCGNNLMEDIQKKKISFLRNLHGSYQYSSRMV